MSQSYRPTQKEYAKLAKRLRKAGWTVEQTRSQHIRWTAPDGRYCITASTPGADGLKHSLRHLANMEAGKRSPGVIDPRTGKVSEPLPPKNVR